MSMRIKWLVCRVEFFYSELFKYLVKGRGRKEHLSTLSTVSTIHRPLLTYNYIIDQRIAVKKVTHLYSSSIYNANKKYEFKEGLIRKERNREVITSTDNYYDHYVLPLQVVSQSFQHLLEVFLKVGQLQSSP